MIIIVMFIFIIYNKNMKKFKLLTSVLSCFVVALFWFFLSSANAATGSVAITKVVIENGVNICNTSDFNFWDINVTVSNETLIATGSLQCTFLANPWYNLIYQFQWDWLAWNGFTIEKNKFSIYALNPQVLWNILNNSPLSDFSSLSWPVTIYQKALWKVGEITWDIPLKLDVPAWAPAWTYTWVLVFTMQETSNE